MLTTYVGKTLSCLLGLVAPALTPSRTVVIRSFAQHGTRVHRRLRAWRSWVRYFCACHRVGAHAQRHNAAWITNSRHRSLHLSERAGRGKARNAARSCQSTAGRTTVPAICSGRRSRVDQTRCANALCGSAAIVIQRACLSTQAALRYLSTHASRSPGTTCRDRASVIVCAPCA